MNASVDVFFGDRYTSGSPKTECRVLPHGSGVVEIGDLSIFVGGVEDAVKIARAFSRVAAMMENAATDKPLSEMDCD